MGGCRWGTAGSRGRLWQGTSSRLALARKEKQPISSPNPDKLPAKTRDAMRTSAERVQSCDGVLALFLPQREGGYWVSISCEGDVAHGLRSLHWQYRLWLAGSRERVSSDSISGRDWSWLLLSTPWKGRSVLIYSDLSIVEPVWFAW